MISRKREVGLNAITYGSCFLLRSGVKPVMLSTTLRVLACDISNCFKYCCISATFDDRLALFLFCAPEDTFDVSNFGREPGEVVVVEPVVFSFGVVKLCVAIVAVCFSGVVISDIVEYEAMCANINARARVCILQYNS